jgi:hypothetical protein
MRLDDRSHTLVDAHRPSPYRIRTLVIVTARVASRDVT